METFFQELEDSQSRLTGLDLKPSSSPKSNPTVADCLPSVGQESQTLETSEEQTSLFGADELMSLAEDFLANRSVRPGSREAEQMSVTSGRQCGLLSQKSGPFGLFVKTCLESSTWGNSNEFVWIWSQSVTKHNRSLFRLTPLGQSTGGNGCSLWRTPNGSDATGGPMNGKRRLEQGHQLNLAEQAATPKLWPTPQAHDAAKDNPNTTSGSLNPRFVEELQGFPIDHTALKRSATQSSPSKSIRSSRRSPK